MPETLSMPPGPEEGSALPKLSPVTPLLGRVITRSRVVGLLGSLALFSGVALSRSGVFRFGYPIESHAPFHEEFTELWARVFHGKRVLDSLELEGLTCEFIGTAEDLSRIGLVKERIVRLKDEMPMPPDPTVKKMVIIFSDQDEGEVQEGAAGITLNERINGIQYVILSGDFNETLVDHELVHALWQTDVGKQLPDFVSEGVVHNLYDPEQDSPPRFVTSSYLFSLEGLYPEDGNLSKGLNPTDADYLQDEVMRRFWNTVAEIDPLVRFKLIDFHSSPTRSLQEIPRLVLSATEITRRPVMQRFLESCDIFKPQDSNHLFVVPDLNPESHPQVMIYYLDSDYYAQDNGIQYWYSSFQDRLTLSAPPQSPLETHSNRLITFKRYAARVGFSFDLTVVDPETLNPHPFTFDYTESGWNLTDAQP